MSIPIETQNVVSFIKPKLLDEEDNVIVRVEFDARIVRLRDLDLFFYRQIELMTRHGVEVGSRRLMSVDDGLLGRFPATEFRSRRRWAN